MDVKLPLAFNIFGCVHTDYAASSCEVCITRCDENIFSLQKGRIILNETQCVACGACIGGCPSEALSLPSFETHPFVKSFIASSSTLLSCRDIGVCLAVFDGMNLLSMALGKDHPVICHMGECVECSLNNGGKLSGEIESMVDSVNRITMLLQSPKTVQISTNVASGEDRRGFFKKIAHVVTSSSGKIGEEGVRETLVHAKTAANAPEKLRFLREVLKEKIESFTTTLLPSHKGFLESQVIDEMVCTNCQECVKSCPTRALTTTTDHEKILFQQGSCIACGVCHEICPEKCITTGESIDLVDLAFNRATVLAQFVIATCLECKAGFVYKGGEQVCARCLTYRDDFAHMFVTAGELE